MPTVKATFGGGIPLVDLDQGSPIPCCFVFELGHELTPTHVTDRFCKAMIFDYVLDCQALDADRLVFTNQFRRKLMLSVFASSSYAREAQARHRLRSCGRDSVRNAGNWMESLSQSE